MDDSPDIYGNEPEDEAPSAAELEAAGQSSMFGAPDPAPAPPPVVTAAPAQPYRVLARKYRPQTFSELIGQDAMVQTLGNAIRRERLAHAFLMTGVRGVGKTSTARLIAKALNCIGPDGQGGPTIDPCGKCEPCLAIAEGRHIDVIEMDAASHTGVDDVREIIEAVRYAAVSARYKIYIIDEVHMLSRNAFNALLKTLEEPPPHVKFLFATTEVDKLPVTVLSRCQRFDLRRIPSPMLAGHFERICAAEGVEAESEALAMVAAAAEGSVRDGLSILDQAIAHADLGGDGRVTAAQVQDMLGLADKSAQRRLFAALLAGDGAALLDMVDQQFALGIEPVALMRAAMELVHRITVTQLGKGADEAASAEERTALEDWAGRLAPGQLHRLWQLLLKGHDEVRTAPDPLVAAKMALLRVQHAADLPDPGQLARKLDELAKNGVAIAAPAASGSAAPSAAAPAAPKGMDWAALVEQVDHSGQLRLAQVMRDWVRVIDLAPGDLTYALAPGYSGDPTGEIREALLRATGERWQVRRAEGDGRSTLRELAEAAKAEADAALRAHPLVAATLAAFPGAELIGDEPEPRAAAQGQKWRN
ncbi:DNA polymerase III subunit gamma/tau [Novosphingobium sp.]|uniref:DNA polymerase III subunit gamma/tau n=1 Tax=Novosphingobium sp. TaxID=1874826 RepID=UPI001EB12AC3|nr:DNA polymerase III subunit gamma/tau [Novosphingobium sp.]MBK6801401.1 DNA polymerase III subunit gamma/tau [Novosphingobium sp.]MBK9010089.1 DNA polymerase III subunit gamma/tau [Novosphingobium sp.]